MAGSKAKRIPLTIFNKTVAENIKKSIESYICGMWKSVYTDNILDSEENNGKDKNRSSFKTDELHKHFKEVLLSCFGNYSDDFEEVFEIRVESNTKGKAKNTKRIYFHENDLFGETFQVDAKIIDRATNKVYATILCKAPMTSIQKNRYNSIENELGQSLRVLPPEILEDKYSKVLFVNYVPNETFTVNKKNKKPNQYSIKKEQPRCFSFYTAVKDEITIIDRMPITDRAKDKIAEIFVAYDLSFMSRDMTLLDELKSEINSSESFVDVSWQSIDYIKYFIYQMLNDYSHIEAFSDILKSIQGVDIQRPVHFIK